MTKRKARKPIVELLEQVRKSISPTTDWNYTPATQDNG